MTTLLEEVLYELPDGMSSRIVVDPTMVRDRLKSIAEDEDLRKWIL
jgi:ATP-dependent HslUV protease ATP-binding subunit HslU